MVSILPAHHFRQANFITEVKYRESINDIRSREISLKIFFIWRPTQIKPQFRCLQERYQLHVGSPLKNQLRGGLLPVIGKTGLQSQVMVKFDNVVHLELAVIQPFILGGFSKRSK